MANIERLLTMGTAHGADPARHLMGGHGQNTPDSERLQWTDVMFAMSMVPPSQRAVLWLRANPDMLTGGDLAELTTHLWRHHCDHGLPVTAERRAAIVRTALAEYTDPRTCRPCRGTGEVLDYVAGRGMVKGTCGRCEGRAIVAWSDNRRARGCGVRRVAWTQLYEAGYVAVLRECGARYRKGVETFKAALFGDPAAVEPLDAPVLLHRRG